MNGCPLVFVNTDQDARIFGSGSDLVFSVNPSYPSGIPIKPHCACAQHITSFIEVWPGIGPTRQLF